MNILKFQLQHSILNNKKKKYQAKQTGRFQLFWFFLFYSMFIYLEPLALILTILLLCYLYAKLFIYLNYLIIFNLKEYTN